MRLRALRKKYNRILQMEESFAASKTLNREQEEVLRSKPVVSVLIDKLECLRAPLSSALAEELSSRPATPARDASSSSDSDSSIQDLLALVYFGSLFDVKPQSEFVATMVARTHERSCCITYDYVTDDAADLLVETDLDVVSALASLAAARPAAAAGVSHRDDTVDTGKLILCRLVYPQPVIGTSSLTVLMRAAITVVVLLTIQMARIVQLQCKGLRDGSMALWQNLREVLTWKRFLRLKVDQRGFSQVTKMRACQRSGRSCFRLKISRPVY